MTGLGAVLASAIVTEGVKSAFSIGGSAATGAIDSSHKASLADEDYVRQRELMKYQSELNSAEFDRQFTMSNEYNSPANQQALLKEAGLNPLYVEGQAQSNASPSSSSVGLGSSSMQAPTDFVGAFRDMMNNLFKIQDFKLKEQEVANDTARADADVDKANTYVVTTGKMTDSQIAVNAAKIAELQKETELSEEQKNFVVQETAALKENVSQRWDELKLKWEQFGLSVKDFALRDYTSRWQEKRAQEQTYNERYSNQTQRQAVNLANNEFKFQLDKFAKDYNLRVAEFYKDLEKSRTDNFVKVFEISSVNIAGTHYADSRWISEVAAALEAFNKALPKMDASTFSELLPYVTRGYRMLDSVEPNKPKGVPYAPDKSSNNIKWLPDEL